ncbi:MAG TPA: alpha/beta hydrolase [Macromonas sp.]|nr:alpha/beta hydrolase [Macromonas sp.]
MPSHNPRALLTPAMRHVLDRMARAGRPPMPAMGAAQAKAFYEAGSGVLDLPRHKMAQEQALAIPVRDGAWLPAELVVPHSALTHAPAPLPVLLYFHGGGFTVGSVATHASLCRHLAHLGHCAVLSVDYRLAPQFTFPTAANDAWDSLQWLHRQAAALGLDPQRIAVGGDSAGGTLSLVCALQARDASLPLALQLLFYPGCTAQSDTASHRTFASGFVLEVATAEWFFGQYLNSPAEREDWRFAPLNAPDFEDVAPVWLGLAECDPLVDGGLQLADRLRMAAVPVGLELYRGVTHEFIKMGRAIPEALQAHQDAGRALRQAFGL